MDPRPLRSAKLRRFLARVGPNTLAIASAVRLFGCSAASPDAKPAGEGEKVQPAKGSAGEARARRVDAGTVTTKEADEEAASASPVPAAMPAEAEAPVKDTRPRIGAVDDLAYIYKAPEKRGLALGYVRVGTSVPLKSEKKIAGGNCKGGFYAVEPRGYVCLDRKTTLDLEDPYFEALAREAPKKGAVWPYRYAYSLGAPMYSRVPTPAEWAKAERNHGPVNKFVSLGEWAKGHEELVLDENPPATDPVPAIFEGGKRRVGGGPNRSTHSLVWRTIPNGSMLSYSKAFAMHGRTWLLTPDLMLVPAERTRVQKLSTFKGVMLEGTDLELPFAWNRGKTPIKKYVKDSSGKFVAAAKEAAVGGASIALGPKKWVEVTNDPVKDGKRTFLPLRREKGVYVDLAEVTVSWPRTAVPKGVKPGQKWIEVKIAPGTMTAFEGTKPVLVTLFSPGKGGVPPAGRSNADHEKYATTKPGFFPIAWKDHVAWMSPDEGAPRTLWMADVPHIQYLEAPLAMHVAYWHEDFGNKKSAECVNVSPEDGKWLFSWTDPPLPEGWGGIRPGDGNGPSTPVVITGGLN